MRKLLLPAMIALTTGAVFAQNAQEVPDVKQQADQTTAGEFPGEAADPEATGECSVEIEGNDAMKYNIDNFTIDTQACDKYTIKLHHVGSLPKNAMGHNVVITRAMDYQDVAKAGQAAGLENNYVDPEDQRVIAHTDVVGGGETTEVTFRTDVLMPDEDYEFFCSFPGHYAMMKGTVEVK